MKKILQAFKGRFKRKQRIYVCDPQLNESCSKQGCWFIYKGPCRCTKKKKCAKRDENGNAIFASDAEITNLEWLEMRLFGQQKTDERVSDL